MSVVSVEFSRTIYHLALCRKILPDEAKFIDFVVQVEM